MDPSTPRSAPEEPTPPQSPTTQLPPELAEVQEMLTSIPPDSPQTEPETAPTPDAAYRQPRPPQAVPSVAGTDPGKTLALFGVVFAILFSPIGLLLSILSKVKSQKAGRKNNLATVGIVLSVIFLILSVIFIPILITTYNNTQDRKADSTTLGEMRTLHNEVLSYVQHSFTIPTELSSLKSMPDFDESLLVDTRGKSYAIAWSPQGCAYLTCETFAITTDSVAYPGKKLTLTYDTSAQSTTLGDGSGRTVELKRQIRE